jgi:DNA-binding CsgD family transcriptional regulator
VRALLRMMSGTARTAKRVRRRRRRILLDREIGGARYVLLRAPSRTRDTASLSPREREIVRMVAAGHPNKVIADILEISSWTVSTHLRRIFAKLGVASRAAMVAKILNDASLIQGAWPSYEGSRGAARE